MKLFIILLLLSGMAEAVPNLFVPKNPKPNTALFVVLHGCLSDAAEAEKTTRMSEFAENLGFYVFYPEPYLGEKLSKGCFEFYTNDSQAPGGGDAAVIMDAVKDIITKYDIDAKKVFMVGMSGGASLVSVLISCYPDQIQGAAIHSGMGYGLASTWQESLLVAQSGPLPMKKRNSVCHPDEYKGQLMLIHGSRDIVMNPRHYKSLSNDYFLGADKNTDLVLPRADRFGYLHQKFYSRGELVGQGIFVIGMNHEWSGYKSLNPIGPLGPDVSKMMVDYFLEITN